MKRFRASLARLVLPCFHPKDLPTPSPSEMETEQALICRESSENHDGDRKDGSVCEKQAPCPQDGNSEPLSGCCGGDDLVHGHESRLGDDLDGGLVRGNDGLLHDRDLVGGNVADAADQPIPGTPEAVEGEMDDRLVSYGDNRPVADLTGSDDMADTDKSVHGDDHALEVDESFGEISRASVTGEVYRFFNTSMFQITDADHKCLLLHELSGQPQLVAMYLQGDNAESQVILNMTSYISRNVTEKRPVTLGIAGSNLYLSCVMNDTDPQLTLESVDKTLTSIRSDLLRFLFFKEGRSNCTFESAACPTWFICTSQADRTLVTVSSSDNQTTIQNFNVLSATH